jgi:serine/threonine-protein kinase
MTGPPPRSRVDGHDEPDRWSRLEAVVPEALDLLPADRAAFLDRACRADDGQPDGDLRREADRLIGAFAEAEEAGTVLSPFDGLGLPGDDPGAPLPGPVGPWRPTARLGEGGMGVVYSAVRTDASFHQRAALKLVRPGFGPDFGARFVHERAVLAGLDHPNVARLLDGGVTADGLPYLAMELVDGVPVTDYAEHHGLTTAARLALFLQVCDAVAYAHRQLVVHRDLKPSNVLVTPEGSPNGGPSVKLLDFGIAKLLGEGAGDALTRSGPGPMSLPYAAPEQFQGRPVTTSTDVYALGVLLFELLAGHRPFDLTGLSAGEAERTVTTTAPPRPSALADTPAVARELRGDLDTAVLKALAKEPERRYASVDALADDLRRYAGGRPVRARPDTLAYRSGRFVRRNRWAVLAGAAAVAGAAALVGFYTARLADERDHALAAQTEAEQVSAFLQRIVAAPNTAWYSEGKALGPETPVRAVLDEAAARLDTVALSPATRADLHRTIGSTYGVLGDHDASLRHARAALRIREALFAPPHPDIAEALYGLAAAHVRRGEEVAAFPLYRRAVAMQRARNEGDNFPFMAQELASRLRDAGRLAEADALLREALAFSEATFHGRHSGSRYRTRLRALLLGELALNAYLQGRLGEAEREVARADRALRALPPDADAQQRWRLVRCVAGMTADARGLDATADLLACAGDPDSRATASPFPVVSSRPAYPVPAVYEAVAVLYDRLGRPADAGRSRSAGDTLASAQSAYRHALAATSMLGESQAR